jgi:iron(III) transport system permease protein
MISIGLPSGDRRPESRQPQMQSKTAARTVADRLLAARRNRRLSKLSEAGIAALIALVLLPVATIAVLALSAPSSVFTHLAATILPRTVWTTTIVLAGTGALTLIVGTLTAWAVTLYNFPGRALIERALLLPLAIPIYIAAYAWVEILAPTGTLHAALSAIFGWRTARDSFLPDLRSTLGAILIASSVLYPYVYLAARASLLQQSATIIEVARTLGCGPIVAMLRVALPLARPALAAGTALGMMEVLGDFGAMQYLGVETLTVAIYTTWLQRSSLGGAAQIAFCALLVVLALLMIERAGRSRRSFHPTSTRIRPLPAVELTGWRARLALLGCAFPVCLGFAAPALVLAGHAIQHLDVALTAAFWWATFHSLLLAGLAALLTVATALVLAYTNRFRSTRLGNMAQSLIGVGYALPGTVLALGLLIPLAAFDNGLDALLRRTTGLSVGLLTSGTILIVLLAYVIRTLAAALGALNAGWAQLSPNLDAASRTLGYDALRTARRVHLPLLKPALGSAAIVVFVECLKELPATLLLRPFNFETLATQVYTAAALEQFEAAGLGALAIVLAGLFPVLLMHRTLLIAPDTLRTAKRAVD